MFLQSQDVERANQWVCGRGVEKEEDNGKTIGPAVTDRGVDQGMGRSERSRFQLIHRLGFEIYFLGILDV